MPVLARGRTRLCVVVLKSRCRPSDENLSSPPTGFSAPGARSNARLRDASGNPDPDRSAQARPHAYGGETRPGSWP
jgi:hypothetical protein